MSNPKKSNEGQEIKPGADGSVENQARLIVHQPEPMSNLLEVLGSLERVKERISDDKSGDLGGSSGGGGSSQAAKDDVSIRDKAIASLPSDIVMRDKMKKHLRREVKELERSISRASKSTKQGGAYTLNELYARIRKIQGLIFELIDATTDLVKRLYIKMFIDRQKVV
jgi:hypothetical protein